MDTRARHADDLIDALIETIETSSAPGQKPWRTADRLPENIATGQPYHGGNLLMLVATSAIKGYTDHRWGGFQQIKATGGATFGGASTGTGSASCAA